MSNSSPQSRRSRSITLRFVTIYGRPKLPACHSCPVCCTLNFTRRILGGRCYDRVVRTIEPTRCAACGADLTMGGDCVA